MRIAEDRIRAAVGHPQWAIGCQALEYWRGEHAADPSVMPLVIQATTKLGHRDGFHLLRKADRLAQTAATLDWLMAELDQPLDVADVAEDNYRFALALLLLQAEPTLLVPRHKAIIALRNFPEQLAAPLDRRLRLSLLEWPALWQELEAFGRRVMAHDSYTMDDSREAAELVAALGRNREGVEQVMRAIELKVPSRQQGVLECLRPELLRIAGKMKLRSAIPHLFATLATAEDDEDALFEACEWGLADIGVDRVVDTIAMSWKTSSWGVRLVCSCVLKAIRSDNSFRWSVRLLEEETDPELRVHLASAVLDQFHVDGFEPVNDLILLLADEPDDLAKDVRDLRYELLIMCRIAGVELPGLAEWRTEAEQSNYGYSGYEPWRMAENF
jgi:hypothetical protein